MPNCFQLFRKSEPTVPVRFTEIDAEICAALNVPCDDEKYYLGWYDFIGLRLACGQSFDDIRSFLMYECPTPTSEWAINMLLVVCFLDTNYLSDAWAEIGRRG